MNNCIPSYAFLYENDFNTRDIDYDIDYDDDDSLSLQSNSIDTNEYKSTLFYDNNNNNNNNYNINMNNNMNKKKKNNNNKKKKNNDNNNGNNNNNSSKIKLDEIGENDWENLVQQSMKKLKNFPGLPANEIISDMFTREKNRLIVKVKKIKYFQIFPWFLIDPKYKYRESTQHRDELYEALNFFWGKSLTEDDYLFIESYYKKKSPNVERCLSSILDLKRLIDNNHGAIQIKAKQNKSAPDYDNRPSKKQRFSLDDIPVHDDLLSSCFSPLQSNSITPLSSAYENLDDTDLSVYSEPINLSDVEENCDNTYSNQSKSCDNSFNKYNQCQTMLDQIQQIKNLLAPSIEDHMYMNDSDFNSLQNHIKSALLILQNNSKNY